MSHSFWRRLQRRLSSRVPARRGAHHISRNTKALVVEFLESRELLTVMQPQYILLHGGSGHGSGITPFTGPGPGATTPAQIRHAYGIDQLNFNNGTVAANGAGTTIAIVDAFDEPNLASDLHQFDLQYGLPDPTLTKMNETGGTKLPAGDSGWGVEMALDVEWAHAIAPAANILVVEANSANDSDLFSAVATAAKQAGVVAVSMSWGGGEASNETTFDKYMTTPSGHQGVTFLVSSGDSGAPASYPATSPNAISVGGTTLNLDSAGNILSESGWSGSGGGISSTEAQPAYQKGVVTQSTTKRANPDVAYDSDPNTGFGVYDTYGTGTTWEQVGGTSDAAPQWAGLIAVADQGRILAGSGSLDGPSQTLPMLYSLPASDFHDITSGTSTGSPNYSAGPGYDLVTGRGTPVANLLIPALAGSQSTPVATHLVLTAAASSTAGSSFSVTVTAADANGKAVAGYRGTIGFTSSDSSAILPGSYTFTAADNGVHTFTVTLKRAGSDTVSAADTSNTAISGSASISVSPAQASTLSFKVQPANVLTNAVISPAVVVQVLDAYGNVVTSDNSDQVKLALGANPGNGTLGGTTTVTASGGSATFSNLTINQAGTGYTLSASASGISGATSSTFNVSTPSTTHLVLSVPASSTAGSSFSLTVTAADANGKTVAGYRGTISFGSSDSTALVPANYTFTAADNGVHTFTVTLKHAGSDTVSGTDTVNSSITGSANVTVSAAAASKLAFSVQPSNSTLNAVISPAVVVQVLDAYGNVVTGDNSDQVKLALGANPGNGTLGGTTTVTVSGGSATFSNLSINQTGNGYTLTAASGSLAGTTSAGFNVTAGSSAKLLEGFETSSSWYVVGGPSLTAARTTAAAHDGVYGLDDYNGNDWIYRTDSAVQVKAGDTISVWLNFSSAADGRAYFGFGSSSSGTLSLVAAPNTGQLIIQQNSRYTSFVDLADANQSYLANHWYRLEVDWGTNGAVVGKIFDSDGLTVLGQVKATGITLTSGGIGFRATGSDKYWDTVTDASGTVGPLVKLPAVAANGTSGGQTGSGVTGQVSAGKSAGNALASVLDAFFAWSSSSSSAETDAALLAFLKGGKGAEWDVLFGA
jgi:subtilase family serine protease